MPNAPHPEPTPLPHGSVPIARRDNALLGIGLILLSSVFMSASDVVSKLLTETTPPLQVTWLRYCSFVVIMLVIVARTGGVARMRTRRPMLQLLRGIGVVASSITFVFSLKSLPIADATATSFVAPLFVTALAIPILGETIGWRRWSATLVGLVGVVIIVRPGGAGFQAASLLPALSALSWAFALIITRMMSTTESPMTTLVWSALVGLVLVSALLPFVWQPLTPRTVALGIFIGVASTIGHWVVILAFRHADASLLAPFSYVQLLGVTVLGYFVFSVLPDIWTLVGAVVVAGSGLYIAHRERLKARRLTL